jgi:hypothetical protein
MKLGIRQGIAREPTQAQKSPTEAETTALLLHNTHRKNASAGV